MGYERTPVRYDFKMFDTIKKTLVLYVFYMHKQNKALNMYVYTTRWNNF